VRAEKEEQAGQVGSWQWRGMRWPMTGSVRALELEPPEQTLLIQPRGCMAELLVTCSLVQRARRLWRSAARMNVTTGEHVVRNPLILD
jgi:hypothetical protein